MEDPLYEGRIRHDTGDVKYCLDLPKSLSNPFYNNKIWHGIDTMNVNILSSLNSPSPRYNHADIEALPMIPPIAFKLEAWC